MKRHLSIFLLTMVCAAMLAAPAHALEESTARGGLKRILLFGGVAAALSAGGVFVSTKIRRRR